MRPVSTFFDIQLSNSREQLQYYRAGETVKITVATPEKNGEYAKSDVEVTLGKKS